MPAEQRDVSFGQFLDSASHNCAENVEVDVLSRKPDNGKSRFRLTPHCVDVTQRVGGGNLSVGVGIVDDRREEIDCLHYCNISCELKYPSIVGIVKPDKHLG